MPFKIRQLFFLMFFYRCHCIYYKRHRRRQGPTDLHPNWVWCLILWGQQSHWGGETQAASRQRGTESSNLSHIVLHLGQENFSSSKWNAFTCVTLQTGESAGYCVCTYFFLIQFLVFFVSELGTGWTTQHTNGTNQCRVREGGQDRVI